MVKIFKSFSWQNILNTLFSISVPLLKKNLCKDCFINFSIRVEPAITTHTALRRCDDFVTRFPCTSQRRRIYVSNETLNDVSVESRQEVSVVRLHDILLEHRDDISRGRNNDVPSARLQNVSNKSQMKHPTTSHWYDTKTSQWYVSTTSHSYVSTTSTVILN